jgi:hypothetical protein
MGILCLVPPDWWRPGLPDEYEHAMAEAGRWPRPEEVRQKESKKISVTIVGWARNRFKPTNDIPPNPAFIEEYLSDAQQTADDARRKKAVSERSTRFCSNGKPT